MIEGTRVNVTKAATPIAGDDADTISTGYLVVQNRHASKAIDLGGSGVKVGEGFELKASEKVELKVGPGETLYGIGPNEEGNFPVHVLAAGL